MRRDVLLSLKDILVSLCTHAVGRRHGSYTCRYCGAHDDSRSSIIHANNCESVIAGELLLEIDAALKGK